jgi:hypothetical protein
VTQSVSPEFKPQYQKKKKKKTLRLRAGKPWPIEPNSAHHLFLDSLPVKNDFHIFKGQTKTKQRLSHRDYIRLYLAQKFDTKIFAICPSPKEVHWPMDIVQRQFPIQCYTFAFKSY